MDSGYPTKRCICQKVGDKPYKPYRDLRLDTLVNLLKNLFLERGGWKEEERERNNNVWLPLVQPQLGTWPATQIRVLTGNQTSDPLV